MTINSVQTDPAAVQMLTTMEQELQFIAQLEPGVTIVSVQTTLYDINTGQTVALSDAPTVGGSSIFQWVRGPTQLTAPHGYRLTCSYTDSTGAINAGVLLINVPFPTP